MGKYQRQYSQFIGETTSWLKEVPSQILRNGARLWNLAYGRYFKRLANRPAIHKKHGKQAVWLTSELFRFEPVIDADTGEIVANRLLIGTKKFPVGELNFVAHSSYRIPRSIHISVNADRWHVSFCFEDDVPVPSEKETAEWLQQFPEEELLEKTFGGDRGVVIPLAGNNGETFDFSAIQKVRLEKKERYVKRWRRIMARRQKGSSNRNKAKLKVARLWQYGKNVRHDFAHKTSHALVSDDRYLLYVFEALKVKNMTARVKPKKDCRGKYVRNGRAAKAGLNKGILSSAWGRIVTFTKYKAAKAGKLAIAVDPQYTSQECSQCGHAHKDNRVNQALFVCQACGHIDNADINAARNIAKIGVRQLIQLGLERPEVNACGVSVSHPSLTSRVQETLKQETLAIAAA
jgi:putative transposase